jgi:hypothetical protein
MSVLVSTIDTRRERMFPNLDRVKSIVFAVLGRFGATLRAKRFS